MAKSFKPSVCYRNQNGVDKSITVKTYVEVKKRMNAFMDDSVDNCITVYRHRKGEWGEWREMWCKVGYRNVIMEQGWM